VEEGAVFAAEVAPPRDGFAVVKASGELDLSSAPELEAALRAAQSERGNVMLDFSELEFIDSTGVHAVLNAFHAAEQAGTEFAITGAGGEVMRAFQLVGLADRLPFR
jgi:anti-sigma B factor antagonist